ncbi:hypothetical protein B0H66DRAFT_552459 [Apodospora peruviana]|uniref:Uncharacterized protein n=1 Tax=Apodospora peruviana TaxID=516989 RepID=A0AAE0IAV0_9PEZI|nr:hypothetical protein B0H66DRAFT_552459 [Apodospora peruviana]
MIMLTSTTLSIIMGLLSTLTSAMPLADPSEVGSACGGDKGDCPSLTCIPLSANCTTWTTSYQKGCPGTCQSLDVSAQRIYTLCGGWALYDDCDERIESCLADPRHNDKCGPSCDGPGICIPNNDYCGWDKPGKECREGTTCFTDSNMACREERAADGTIERICGGVCLPLRYGSDYYNKTRLEEVRRTDQDGYQHD